MHESAEEYAIAKATLEQSDLIEQFYRRYSRARDRAIADAERARDETAGK
jgi:hypothetical protein